MGQSEKSIIFVLMPTCIAASIISAGAAAVVDASDKVPQQRRVSVVYQLTDVTVTNRRGDYVGGLTPEDFLLEVDGRATPVKLVEEAQGPRSIIFLFDRYSMGGVGLDDAKRKAARFVDEVLREGDRAAVLQYNQHLQTLCGWTDERDKILEAIGMVGGTSRNAFYFPSVLEVTAYQREANLYQFDDEDRGRDIVEKAFAVEQLLASLQALASALEKVPGRKTCIYFSEGPNFLGPNAGISKKQLPREYLSRKSIAESAGIRKLNILTRLHNNRVDDLTLREADVDLTMKPILENYDAANTTLCVVQVGPEEPQWLTESAEKWRAEMNASVYRMSKIDSSLQFLKSDRLNFLRRMADMSGGTLLGAEQDAEDLVASLSKAVGNYYVLGFEPPEAAGNTFHRITISPAGGDLRIEHRRGFFGKTKFADMSAREKRAHLQESMLAPGIHDELLMQTRSYALPLLDGRAVILALQIDASMLGASAEGRRELEMVTSVVDGANKRRFHDHRIYSGESSDVMKLWRSREVPLPGGWCAVSMVVRDNSTGRRSSWNWVFEQAERGGPVRVSDPILLGDDDGGSISTWAGVAVDDDLAVVDPLEPIGLDIPGKPMPTHSLPQGESARLVLTLSIADGGFDPSKAGIAAHYILAPSSETSYLLEAGNQRISFLPSQRMLLLSASVPLGLAQRRQEELGILVTGVVEGSPVGAVTSFTITDFDQRKAVELLRDPRISIMN